MARDYAKSKRQKGGQRRSGAGAWIISGVLIGVFIAGLVYLKVQSNISVLAEQAVSEVPNKAKQQPAKGSPSTTKAPQPHFDFYTMLPKVNAATPPGKGAALASDTSSPKALIPAEAAQPESPAEVDDVDAADETEDPQFAEAGSKASTVSQVDVATLAKQSIEQELEQQTKAADNGNAATEAAATSGRYVLELAVLKDYKAADRQRAQWMLEGFDVNITKTQKNTDTVYRIWMGPYPTLQVAKQQQKRLKQSRIKSILAKES